MKYSLFIFILIFLIACDNETPPPTVITETQVITETYTEYLAQDFEGDFFFDYHGYIKMVADDDNRVYILNEGLFLPLVNIDETLGNLPNFTTNKLEINQNKLRVTLDLSYRTTNNVKSDLDGTILVARQRTDLELFLDEESHLNIKIQVWNVEKTAIIVERTLISD